MLEIDCLGPEFVVGKRLELRFGGVDGFGDGLELLESLALTGA